MPSHSVIGEVLARVIYYDQMICCRREAGARNVTSQLIEKGADTPKK